MTTLVLASASPARAQVLRAAGVEPIIAISDVDEAALLDELRDESFPDQVLALAQAKCEFVAANFTTQLNTCVLGCDSMFELDGQLFGKPHSAEQARTRLREMSGRTGTLHTGHWLVDPARGRAAGAVASTEVTICELTPQDIDAYVASGEPLHVAGSFTLDGLGGAFVAGIDGDPSNVIGVSLPLLRALVTELSYSWPDFWQSADR